MFTAYWKTKYTTVTVYAVDFNHDMFLIGLDDKFKWVERVEFTPDPYPYND